MIALPTVASVSDSPSSKNEKALPFGSRITMAEIPEELIVQILLLLPVSALLRFKCVSKRWRNLIDSPNFIKSQLDHPRKAHSVMIFVGKPNAYYVDLISVCNATGPHPILKELTNPSLGNFKFGVLGPCNGLFCIHTRDRGSYCLWNPLTRKHFHVPQISVRKPDGLLWSWGFGYDCNSDDYKVVCIACSKVGNDGSSALVTWIYSLKSGFWKCIGEPPYLLGYEEDGVFVSGALHWIQRPHRVVAFDLGKSEWNLVPLPQYRSRKIETQIRFGVLDGCLYAIYHNHGTHAFDLWVMKEYGVKESWTRLIACPSYTTILTPLAYTEADKELIFVAGSNFRFVTFSAIVRYEFETKSFKGIFHPSWQHLRTPVVYIPSLVSPQSGGNSNVAL